MKFLRSNKGDTIVEVLFALAILSLVLTSAYSFTGRNLLAGRQAQERSEALQIVQGQIEALSAAARAGNASIKNSTVYCFSQAGAITNSSALDPNASLANDPLDEYASECETGTDGRYKVAVRYTPDISGSTLQEDQYTVTARWFRIGGGTDSKDEVKIIYRVHIL